MTERQLLQHAPFPEELAELVKACTYKPGWTLKLLEDHDRGHGRRGMALAVGICAYDSTDKFVMFQRLDRAPRLRFAVYFPVPPEVYDRPTWTRWLLEQLLKAEMHEALEFFQIDGVRPFWPQHEATTPGCDQWSPAWATG